MTLQADIDLLALRLRGEDPVDALRRGAADLEEERQRFLAFHQARMAEITQIVRESVATPVGEGSETALIEVKKRVSELEGYRDWLLLQSKIRTAELRELDRTCEELESHLQKLRKDLEEKSKQYLPLIPLLLDAFNRKVIGGSYDHTVVVVTKREEHQ